MPTWRGATAGDRGGSVLPRPLPRPLGRQERPAQGRGREGGRIVYGSAVAIPAQADTALTAALHRAVLETFPSNAKGPPAGEPCEPPAPLSAAATHRAGKPQHRGRRDEARRGAARCAASSTNRRAATVARIAAALSEMIDELVGRGDRAFAVTRNAAALRKRALIAGMSTSAPSILSAPARACPAPAISIPSSPRSSGPAASARRRSRLMPASCGCRTGPSGCSRRRWSAPATTSGWILAAI